MCPVDPAEPLLDVARLTTLLGPAACRFDVDARAVCTSTSSELLGRPAAPSGSVLVADRQTAGRGRRGRAWVSAPEASLTFSLLWRFNRPPAAMPGLSLAVGIALAQALERFAAPVRLKWPNDILLAREGGWGKLGGVLVESTAESAGTLVVIGIGINLRAPDAAVVAALPPVGLAAGAAPTPDRHAVLAALLADLPALFERFDADGFAPFVAAWQARNAFAGAAVTIEEGGRVLAEGRCVGVDADGALLLDAGGRIERWLSGDLSLRSA